MFVAYAKRPSAVATAQQISLRPFPTERETAAAEPFASA